MVAGLKVVTWRGNNINDVGTYESHFLMEQGSTFDTHGASTIETERPNNFPVFVRSQPDGLRFTIEIYIRDLSQATLDQLKNWFNPKDEPGYLVAADNMGESPSVQRQLLCTVEKLMASSVNVFKAVLRASTGVWEETADETPVVNVITATGQTFNIVNDGSSWSQPVFTLKPKVLLTNGNSWVKRRHLVIVNRSESPLYDSIGDGYPLLICDLSSLSPAVTPSAAVRVIHNGIDIPRYISGNKLWINLTFRPRKTFILQDDITSGYTGVIIPSNPEGLVGWPEEGFFVIDNEAIQYNNLTSTTLNIIAREALGTTAAAHSPDTVGYWLEHTNLYLIYDYSVAADAPSPPDRQPVIDLDNSDNNHWIWENVFFSINDRHSGTWRREYSEDNIAARFIRSYEAADKMVFENFPPVAGRILANNAIMEVPCALSMTIPSIELTVEYIGEVPVEGYAYRRRVVRTDFGYSTFQTGERYVYQSSPSGYTVATRSVLQQVSSQETELSNTFPHELGTESEFSVYSSLQTGNYQVEPVVLPPGSGGQGFFGSPERQPVPTSTTNTTFNQEKGIIDNVPMVFNPYGVDSEGHEALLTIGGIAAVPIFRVRLNAEIPIGEDLEGEPFTEAPNDVEDGTSAFIRIDDITIEFDQNRTPRIVISAEQSLYLLNCRLTNTTTEDYLDIALLMLIDEELEIDCVARTIIELVRDIPVQFAIAASNPAEWLYNKNGTNVYQLDMAGIGSGEGNLEITEVHRNRWL
jgi:hypothetical protein